MDSSDNLIIVPADGGAILELAFENREIVVPGEVREIEVESCS